MFWYKGFTVYKKYGKQYGWAMRNRRKEVLFLWRVESESHSMDRFQVDVGVGLEIFP